ncbi:sporulation protein YqfD [Thermosediminibacter oceani]|uniref:Sporulation protein YqfD n=1 Tax=Thermosediminibacter oceani (strain ATCC BAA-1034 / DSM 16646 / JW/IW-1228P) TaxID=555079 RepID=D9S2Q3_THEOJ|nr:sporulation protein YqfD [Thermosediminibacter oceani]ADL07680.1 sporulation protein YqfD [Thermosediminibacter oceani DSM 16646]
MLLIKLWNCLRGYVIIKIVGPYGERLINQAALHGLYLWDIKRIDEDVLLAKISVHGFFELRPLARKTRCRIYVLQRCGLFFSLYRLKRRKALIGGVLFFIAIMYILSSIVWSVQVNTQDETLKLSILKDLEEWGLKPGVFKHNIDKKYYLDKILFNYKNIAWAEIEIRGTRVIIDLVSKEMPPRIEDDTPCNIVASKDGVIEEVIPFRGEAVVKPGDTVSKGDVLISGSVTLVGSDNTKDHMLVRAKGIVKARVWYRKSVEVPLVELKKSYTGRVKKAYRFKLGNREIDIQWGDVKFPAYVEENLQEKQILPANFGNLKFNVVLYREVKEERRFLGVEGAAEEARKKLSEELRDLPQDLQVVQKKMEFTLNQEKQAVIGTLMLEVIEDIGVEQKIN